MKLDMDGEGSRAARLLLADDDERLRTLLRTTISLAGPVEIVAEAADGVEAVELAYATRPDLVLLDYAMPRLDGLTAAELILHAHPQTDVILHTATVTPELQAHAEALDLPLLDKMHVDALLTTLAERLDCFTAGSSPWSSRLPALLAAMRCRHTSEDAVIVADGDGRVFFYNVSAARLLQLPTPTQPLEIDEMYRTFTDASHDAPPVSPLRETLRHGEGLSGQLTIRRGARSRTLVFATTPLPDGGGSSAAVFWRELVPAQ
jgi:CheY-like chemotaxis protein